MDGAIPITGKRVPHRRAPLEVWDRIREDFLSGLPAAECSRRHGVGVSTINARAAAEGWRRADQPWPDPRERLDPADEGRILDEAIGGDLEQTDLSELAFVAVRRMMRAVLKGDAVAALRWRRVHQALEAQDEALQRKLSLFERDHPELHARVVADAHAASLTEQDEQDEQDEQEEQDGVFDRPDPAGSFTAVSDDGQPQGLGEGREPLPAVGLPVAVPDQPALHHQHQHPGHGEDAVDHAQRVRRAQASQRRRPEAEQRHREGEREPEPDMPHDRSHGRPSP